MSYCKSVSLKSVLSKQDLEYKIEFDGIEEKIHGNNKDECAEIQD